MVVKLLLLPHRESPRTHHEDRKRKVIQLTVHKNTFSLFSPLHSASFRLKVSYYIIILRIVIVLCQSSLVIRRHYDFIKFACTLRYHFAAVK